MPHRVDFSRNARVYDRRRGAFLTEDESSRLWQAAGLQPGNRVRDIGAGTGRVAVPFAERGAEVVVLPCSAASFQVVVIARLLYLAPGWQQILAEVSRVLSAGGCLLHEWGNGRGDEDWVRIREQARSLFEEAGVASPFHPGVRSEADVHDYLESIGFRRCVEVSLGPGPAATLGEFLRRLSEEELSYIRWSLYRRGAPDRSV